MRECGFAFPSSRVSLFPYVIVLRAEVIVLEIDLERARHALLQLGTALEEARGVIRPGPNGLIRVKTDDRVVELPVSWAVAGAVAFAVAAILSTVPMPSVRRRERSEEPLGIG